MRVGKQNFVEGLLAAKHASGKTFNQIAEAMGVTNAYAASLLYNQAQLKTETADALRRALPALTGEGGGRLGEPAPVCEHRRSRAVVPSTRARHPPADASRRAGGGDAAATAAQL